ncbi:V-type ATP synthase subunit I [Roseiconus nitratireducens]|uniref:V-type ATP synthase subunit I n=1 Tax=Roseiconus nitratireducens TaxID=2605748 RepID=A0A5M6CWW9_9BACT|nr:V-type ATP synthase subunit I [Roseiconus nitratireducens]KAA5539711.1 V-type ATP synthase subunit I [Roseiconus nitratireducens]
MAIVPLSRVTFVGSEAQRESMLEGLQQLGCLHVLDISGEEDSQPWEHPKRNDMHAALRYLQQCPVQRPEVTHPTDYHAHQITDQALANRDRLRELHKQREDLGEAIERTRPWGEFRLPSGNALKGQSLWFYRLRHRQLSELPPDTVHTVINRDREFCYVVVVAPELPSEMPVPPIELDRRPLSELRAELARVEEEIEAANLERMSLTRWVSLLHRDLATADLEVERGNVKELLRRDGPLVAIQAWAPKKRLPELQEFAREHELALLASPPSETDQPPTLLHNPAPVSGAEGAVTFFMTPGYGSWDPTWIMYLSFSLFFAMIMADAGYGVVLGAILAFVWKRLGSTESGRQFRYLAVFMVAVTIGYGVLIGSYFGISPPEGSLPDRLVIKSGGEPVINNREAMMLFAATIGVFHLALANVIVAWQLIGKSRALSHVGWVSALIGGWMMALGKIPKPAVAQWLSTQVGGSEAGWVNGLWNGGMVLLGAGLALVLFFTSERPLFSKRPIDWLMRPVDGLMGLTNITKAFGDALSYLRLFALGLASAQLAIIFNQLASDASQIRGVGLLLGLLIFLVGHTLNLVLAIVGGVVHGLRLNCIEFFSWSLTEEGQPFHAFGKKG